MSPRLISRGPIEARPESPLIEREVRSPRLISRGPIEALIESKKSGELETRSALYRHFKTDRRA